LRRAGNIGHGAPPLIASWNRAFPSRHPVVEAQRARIVAILCRLATPGCEVTTNIAP